MSGAAAAAYTACMSPNRVKVLGIPTAVIVFCALFVLTAFHLDQSIQLQLIALLARLVIVVAFVFFMQAWRKTVLAYW